MFSSHVPPSFKDFSGVRERQSESRCHILGLGVSCVKLHSVVVRLWSPLNTIGLCCVKAYKRTEWPEPANVPHLPECFVSSWMFSSFPLFSWSVNLPFVFVFSSYWWIIWSIKCHHKIRYHYCLPWVRSLNWLFCVTKSKKTVYHHMR